MAEGLWGDSIGAMKTVNGIPGAARTRCCADKKAIYFTEAFRLAESAHGLITSRGS